MIFCNIGETMNAVSEVEKPLSHFENFILLTLGVHDEHTCTHSQTKAAHGN